MADENPLQAIPYTFEQITFAIAAEAPVAVLSVSFSGHLSRLYLWNTDTDTFTDGQFLKGRSKIYDISPDGKYFAYYAESFHKQAKSYIGVAKPPYFSALAFFPTFHMGWSAAEFVGLGCLKLHTQEPGWWGDYCSTENRIEPGCPFKIVEDIARMNETRTSARDLRHGRQVWTEAQKLMALEDGLEIPVLLKEFTRVPFRAIEPPDWAKVW